MTPLCFLIVAVVNLSLVSTPRDAVAGETAEPASSGTRLRRAISLPPNVGPG